MDKFESIGSDGIEQELSDARRATRDLASAEALRLAREAAGGGPDGDDAVAASIAFLHAQRRLAELEIEEFRTEKRIATQAAQLKRTSDMLRIATQAAFAAIGLVLAAALVLLAWSTLRTASLVARPFSTPASFAERGLDGRAVSAMLVDEIGRVQHVTRLAARSASVRGAWSSTAEIRTGDGFAGTMLQLLQLLRDALDRDTMIDGTLTAAPDGTVTLTVRGSGLQAVTVTGPEASLPSLVASAADRLYGTVLPGLYAMYLNDTGRPADTIAFATTAYPEATGVRQLRLANAWGDALLMLNRPKEALSRYRLALAVDPDYWPAWNNIVGILPNAATEQAALDAVARFRRRADRFLFGGGPGPENWINVHQLTPDPGAEVADLLAARREAERVGAEYNDSAWIAEAEAVRHDWSAVARFLAESPPDEPVTGYDRVHLAGLEAIERGDPATALARMNEADALWRRTPLLQGYFPDFPCDLGLALALTGARAAAAPLFAAGDRFVRCRTFRADTTADPAAALRAYHHAEAVTPGLAFAWSHAAAWRLGQGDPAAALRLAAIAHRLSPFWADPLAVRAAAERALGHAGRARAARDAARALAPAWQALGGGE